MRPIDADHFDALLNNVEEFFKCEINYIKRENQSIRSGGIENIENSIKFIEEIRHALKCEKTLKIKT